MTRGDCVENFSFDVIISRQQVGKQYSRFLRRPIMPISTTLPQKIEYSVKLSIVEATSSLRVRCLNAARKPNSHQM